MKILQCHRSLLLVAHLLVGIGALQMPLVELQAWPFQAPAAKQPDNFDGPAELPRVYMDTALRATPVPGKVRTVRAGEDATAAVGTASCGDTILLQAGATFGSLILPAKNCDDGHWIVIRTSAPDSKLPPEGTRLTPCYAGVASLPGRPDLKCASTENVLAKIEFSGKGGAGPVVVKEGANHYRLIGLEVTRSNGPGTIFHLIGPDAKPADHLILDRMWIHGTAQSETTRGVMFAHMRYAAVIDSYLSDFHCIAKSGACVDAQAIAGGNGDDPMGPFKIVNNFLEASGECILLGGGAATMTPADIEIRHNHFFKPITWMRGQPGFVGAADGNPFIAKNLFELKNAQRVLLEGNILENSWGGFTQRGWAIAIGPKNQAGRMGDLCPMCQVTDVTIRYDLIRHAGSGLVIASGLSDRGAAAKDSGRISVHDVVVDDIQADAYDGFGVFAQISTAPGVTAAVPLHDVRIDHVTAFAPRGVFILGGPRVDPRMDRLSVTNSIFSGGAKPIITTGGGVDRNCSAQPGSRSVESVFHDCFVSYSFHHNVIVGGDGGWPKENKTPGKLEEIGFEDAKNGTGGDYRLMPDSKFKHAASDQKDIGADIDRINQETASAQ